MTTPPRDDHTLAVVAALLGTLAVLVSGVVIVTVLAPKSEHTGTIVAVLLFGFSTYIPTLANSITSGRTARKVDKVLNGVMDTKIQDGVRVVMDERDGRTP